MLRDFCRGLKKRRELPQFFDVIAACAKGWTPGDKMESPHKFIGDIFRRAPASTLAAASSEGRFKHLRASLKPPPMLRHLKEHGSTGSRANRG